MQVGGQGQWGSGEGREPPQGAGPQARARGGGGALRLGPAAAEAASIPGGLPAPSPPPPAPRHVRRFLPGPYKALPPGRRPIQGASFPARLAGGLRAAVGGSLALRVRPRSGASGQGTRCQGGGGQRGWESAAGPHRRPGLGRSKRGTDGLGSPTLARCLFPSPEGRRFPGSPPISHSAALYSLNF